MKKYEMPEMQIVHISAEDVITTSGGITGGSGGADFGGGGNLED